MKLSSEQEKLFATYYNVDEGMGFHFKALEHQTGFPRDKVRAIVRQLAGFGLLEFMRGCMNEDGEFYGSAYVLTPAGHAALSQGGQL